jgi:hypothetical protein
MQQDDVTRDISYAPRPASRGGRALIRALENATGRLALIRRAAGYEDEVARGRSFWQVIPERFGLTLDILRGDAWQDPRQRPADPDREPPLRHPGRADDGPYPVWMRCAAISASWPTASSAGPRRWTG